MKVGFRADEWYPVYSLMKPDDNKFDLELELDLTEQEIEDFSAMFERFDKWQRRIHEIYLNR